MANFTAAQLAALMRKTPQKPTSSLAEPSVRRAAPAVQPWRGPCVQEMVMHFPLPWPKCSSNARYCAHWSSAAKDKAAYRAECAQYLPSCIMGCRAFDRADIEVTFYLGKAPGRYHPRDEQNAQSSIKGLVDALVSAGIIYDDDIKHLHWRDVCLVRRTSEAFVRVKLTRVDE